MRHKLLLAFAVASVVFSHAGVDGYSLLSYKWKTAQVPFYINPQNGDVTADAAETALRSAANVWGSQSNANFSFYYMGRTTDTSVTRNSRNAIFFRTGTGEGIAVTYMWANGSDYLEFDIVFYDGNRFFGGSSGCTAPGWYITDIAAHELGHGLGLGHSGAADATMYGGIRDCWTDFRTLASDDIAAIEKLYPPTGTTTAPSSPSNMRASVNAASPTSSIQVSWSDTASNESGFSVERSANGGSYVEVARLGSNVTSFVNSGLASGTSYSYRARAYNSGGYSAYSNAASATTQSTTSSTSSTNFALSTRGYKVKGMQKVDLRWSGTTASSLVVYRNGAKITTVPNTGAYTDPVNRKGGATYVYQVCASGTTTCSNKSQVTF